MYLADLPASLRYPGLGAMSGYTDADFAAAIKELHGYAASLGELRTGYENTHDPRYLESVKAILPLYQKGLAKAQDISRALSKQELPSNFMLVLSDFSDWLTEQTRNIVEGITGTVKQVPNVLGAVANPLVLIALGAGLFLAFGGAKLFRGRGT